MKKAIIYREDKKIKNRIKLLEIELKKNKTGISAVEMLVVGRFSGGGCV